MIKKIGAALALAAAGVALTGGVASATTTPLGHDHGYGHMPGYGHGHHSQGILSDDLNNIDILHNVNVSPGLCDDNVNVLGVQVPVQHSLDGLALPLLSPGADTSAGEGPYVCSASSVAGDSAQGN